MTNNEIEKALVKPKYETYEDFPIEDLLIYAGIDCIVTSDLGKALMPALQKKHIYTYFETGKGVRRAEVIPSILDSYLEYTAPALDFIIDLELNGFQYDVELNAVMKKEMEEEIASLEASIFEAVGRKVNLDSGQSLSEFLYVEKGLEVKAFTKTNEPSTDGEALKALSEAYPEHTWLLLIAKRNDIASAYRTFVANYVEDFVKSDGRIHPSYNLHGTGSFRIAGENPNLTQLPRPKHGYNVRKLFKVRDGYVLIAADYASAEVKILGALSKDEKLLQAIAEGKDFHSYSASEMHGIDYETFVAIIEDKRHLDHKRLKNLRQGSKALTFGILKLLRL